MTGGLTAKPGFDAFLGSGGTTERCIDTAVGQLLSGVTVEGGSKIFRKEPGCDAARASRGALEAWLRDGSVSCVADRRMS